MIEDRPVELAPGSKNDLLQRFERLSAVASFKVRSIEYRTDLMEEARRQAEAQRN